MIFRRLLVVLFAFVCAACVDEDPTNVGDALIPSGGALTFEVLLPAASFLQFDTSFSGYAKPIDALFSVVARQFEGALDANALLRFSLAPRFISVRTTGTTIVQDSAPRYSTGRLVIKFDTLITRSVPSTFKVFRTAEAWDPTATWTHRVDTANVRLPWATPGGTRGAEIGSATWTAGDSIVIAIDSQTVAIWNDSTNQARGALVVGETAGSRVNILSATVHLDARSSVRADTVVNVTLVPTIRTFVFTPEQPASFSGIRVGGLPTWRSILRFRPDLRTLVLPCAGGPAGCSVSLDSVHINIAQLILRPVASPPGFVPEDSLFVEARTMVTAASVPLERSPVGARLSRTDILAPSLFRSPAAADVVVFDVTQFLIHMTDDNVKDEDRLPPLISLLQLPEAALFGFASFEAAPTLRLVLTTALERR